MRDQALLIARRIIGASGLLALALTVALVGLVFWFQWIPDLHVPGSALVTEVGPQGQAIRTTSHEEYLIETAVRQGTVFGACLLASMIALVVALRARTMPLSAGIAALIAALILIVVGSIGVIGISIVVVYLPIGVLALSGAAIFFAPLVRAP